MPAFIKCSRLTQNRWLGKLGHQGAICWLKKELAMVHFNIFFRNKTFLFVKIEIWNFQHLCIWFRISWNLTKFQLIQTTFIPHRNSCMNVVWMSWNFVRFHEILNQNIRKLNMRGPRTSNVSVKFIASPFSRFYLSLQSLIFICSLSTMAENSLIQLPMKQQMSVEIMVLRPSHNNNNSLQFTLKTN